MKYRILNSIKNSHFIFPKKKFYLGKIQYYCPYYLPVGFLATIIRFDKISVNAPKKYLRNKNVCIFNYNISYGLPFAINRRDLGWKDKFNSPRFEFAPHFMFFFFKWQFCIFWNAPAGNNEDDYWEQFLWYSEYSDRDLKKAKSTWPWRNKGKSTWNENYLKITFADERNIKINSILNE